MGTILVILVIAALVVLVALTRLYVKTPANMAFIRTGLGGKKVVIDQGAVVLPWVQSIQWISLETFKLEVYKAQKEAFITKDRFRVDIGAEFYVKVEPTPEAIERAVRSLGEKSFSAEGIQTLVEEKLVSALRSTAAKMELTEMHENRRGFALAVMESLREALIPNGLMLEDVSIFHLDQTDRAYLDPGNIFDAEGLRQIAVQVSERSRQRNEIERNTEVAIKRKDVEAVKLKLTLDQERELAEAEQMKAVETHRAQRKAETEQFKFEQDRLTREAEIAKTRAIREVEILEDRAIREAEIKRETYLIEQIREKERTEIDKERAIEEAQREKEIAVILKERERLEEERRRLQAEALKEQAAQEVVTVAEKLATERTRELALIHALRELEVTVKKAEAMERLASAKMKDGEAEAYGVLKHREAENTLNERIIYRDLLLALIERAPQIVGELMAPAKQIESIKVLDINGFKMDGANGEASGVGRVINSFLSAGAALPLLKELLDFAKVDPQQLIKKVAEQLPGVKEVLGPKGS
ncbi:MAG: flotillin [candidate division NC10 bacterium]|nr:flotillin [candidate division NC10 bacterium]